MPSTEPNIQNIPIRTELGTWIRRSAATSAALVAADYSQAELRVLAILVRDHEGADGQGRRREERLGLGDAAAVAGRHRRRRARRA